MDSKILYQLKAINWDFFNKAKGLSNRSHSYPCTFPPEVPSALIQTLSSENQIIFDPYVGIGTTACEAIRLGRKCIVTDINPVGLLGTYTTVMLLIIKITDIDKAKLIINYFDQIINRSDCISFFDSDFDFTELDKEMEKRIYPSPKNFFEMIVRGDPEWEKLGEWIETKTLEKIRAIYTDQISLKNSFVFRILTFSIISSISFTCSSQKKSWGHIADCVRPKEYIPKNATAAYNRWLKRIRCIVNDTNTVAHLEDEIYAWIMLQDWNNDISKEIPKNSASLLITSPPYGNAMDYIRAQRISLYALGYDEEQISKLAKQEIGARRDRFKKNAITDWADALEYALRKQVNIINDNAILSFILPHQDTGRELGTNSIKNYLSLNGWQLLFSEDRSIDQQKTSHVWTSIKRETLMVFSKEIKE